MRISRHALRFLHRMLVEGVATRRTPDLVIGGEEHPYLRRWFILPRNRFFNVYLHHFLRSDDNRALHDHPWGNCSLLLIGCYVEHTIRAGGVNVRTLRRAGDVVLRRAKAAHRVELLPMLAHPYPDEELKDEPCWTLFITGPHMRSWGFHCPKGWVHWRIFTNPEDGGRTVGRGCGEGATE
ncbi:MAG: hypothetical protein Q8M31_21770 [Beijerinckiaceae bacterium]|nr:hypothetical protein [Beijerinckiaceae bacterium]